MTDLLDTLRFRNEITARNRIALAAMTNSQSHADGSLGDDELRWLEVRADGGFGIIATCATHVTRDGQGWAGELGIFDDSLLPDGRRLASSMRQRGALPIAQIFHGGMPTMHSRRVPRPSRSAAPAIVNPDWPLRIDDPAWEPRRPPLTAAESRALGLNDAFIESLRSRQDFVAP